MKSVLGGSRLPRHEFLDAQIRWNSFEALEFPQSLLQLLDVMPASGVTVSENRFHVWEPENVPHLIRADGAQGCEFSRNLVVARNAHGVKMLVLISGNGNFISGNRLLSENEYSGWIETPPNGSNLDLDNEFVLLSKV